jgi:hypothetical protein
MLHIYASVLAGCVAYVCIGYTRVLKFFLVFFKCFRRMLQLFYLDVAKVDQVLHML